MLKNLSLKYTSLLLIILLGPSLTLIILILDAGSLEADVVPGNADLRAVGATAAVIVTASNDLTVNVDRTRQEAVQAGSDNMIMGQGVTLTPASAAQSGDRGAIVIYALILTNIGDVPDSYTLTVSSMAFTTTVTPALVGPLSAGASQGVTVTVKIPVNIVSGASDIATITATSQGNVNQSAISILTTTATTLNPIFDFPSIVVDTYGRVYELWEIQTATDATLVNYQFAQENGQLYELNHRVISLQANGATKLVWLPLIRQLRRLETGDVEVTLFRGDGLSGRWVRNAPTMYYHESTSEYIIGVQINEQGRQTIEIPWNTITSIENKPAPDQRVKFQELVHDYLDNFKDTARPVTVTRWTYPPLTATFGFIVDGGGAWSSYTWDTPHNPSLKFWQRNTQTCTSSHYSYPPADEVPLNQVSVFEFTGEKGECGCMVADLSLSNGTVVTGSLISRGESYGGIWYYCTYLNVDSMILFSPYGADSVPLTDVKRVEFSTDKVCLWYDDCWWLLGVNYPWLHYGHDFGQAAWSGSFWVHDGMSTPASKQQVESDFAYLRSKGVHTLRLFVFGDGRASPEFNGQGYATGFDDHFYTDFDTALSLACKYDLHLIPVLLDYLWLDTPQWVSGVQLGGHTDVITDSAKRQSFLDNALMPLLERYGNHRCIIAWDVINEPEWAMRGVPGGGTTSSTVTITEMQSFVQDVVNYIHLYASQAATLGSAQGQWLPYWQGMNLDFYQFHYYDWMGQQPPLVSYSDLGLDKPAILGEFPTKSTVVTMTRYLSITWDNGYAGALAWSLNGNDNASDFKSSGDEFQRWSQVHGPDVNIPWLCEVYSLASVVITGPALGIVSTPYTFTASIGPVTTTLPITYVWQATGQVPVTNTAGLSNTITLTWNVPGMQVITVTATNGIGTVTNTRIITIHGNTYLPLVFNRWPPIPYAPTLSAIGNVICGTYPVSWTESPQRLADMYIVQEANDPTFAKPYEVCTTREESCWVYHHSAGTYYYRVCGQNTWGNGGWSKVESAKVLLSPLCVAPDYFSVQGNEFYLDTRYGAIPCLSSRLGGVDVRDYVLEMKFQGGNGKQAQLYFKDWSWANVYSEKKEIKSNKGEQLLRFDPIHDPCDVCDFRDFTNIYAIGAKIWGGTQGVTLTSACLVRR